MADLTPTFSNPEKPYGEASEAADDQPGNQPEKQQGVANATGMPMGADDVIEFSGGLVSEEPYPLDDEPGALDPTHADSPFQQARED